MSNEQKFWFIRLGQIEKADRGKDKTDYKFGYEFYYEHLALRYDAISIGFDIEDDISDIIGKDLDYVKNETEIREASQVHNFVNGMKQGDIVITQMRVPEGGSGKYEYGIASVIDDYQQVKDIVGHKFLPSSGRPARKVAWIKTRLKETDFGTHLKHMVNNFYGTLAEFENPKDIKDAIFHILTR